MRLFKRKRSAWFAGFLWAEARVQGDRTTVFVRQVFRNCPPVRRGEVAFCRGALDYCARYEQLQALGLMPPSRRIHQDELS